MWTWEFPQIQLDWWLGLAALGASTAVTASVVHKVFAGPQKMLADFGYENATKDSTWTLLNSVLRQVALTMALVNVIAFYNWYSVSMASGIWFWIMFDLVLLSVCGYRGFVEDVKNGLSSDKSKDNAKKLLKVAGAKTGLLAFSAVIFYFEFYNGTNYVKDSKHGLPEELTMMLGVVRNKFLKGAH